MSLSSWKRRKPRPRLRHAALQEGSEMKWITLALGIVSAALWLAAAMVKIPFGWSTDEARHAAEKKVGWLNATAAAFSAATAVASAFSN